MQVLELWFPGPEDRPVYHLESRPAVAHVARWDRCDLQATLAGRRLPHAEALAACPLAWQSTAVQTGLLINRYDGDVDFWSESIAAWRRYDVLVVHWQSPAQIAWCLHALWSLRLRHAEPRVILWGRHTSYGRDVSTDLRQLQSHTVLARLFDAIVCTTDSTALNGVLRFLAEGTTADVGATLLSQEEHLNWFEPLPAGGPRHGPPVTGTDLHVPGATWCGVGVPRELAEPAAFIRWQPASAHEQIGGVARLAAWMQQGKRLTLQMPIECPWPAGVRRKELQRLAADAGARVVPYHHHKIQLPIDLPDWCN